MGSTGVYREPGQTDRAFFEREFPNTLGKYGRILACASTRTSGGEYQRVFYAAVANNADAPHAPGETWALVVLMANVRGDSYTNFWYKELSDSMGPGEDDCPTKILDLLTPTDSEWANEWRDRCRANADKRAKAAAVTNLQILTFAQPMRFTGVTGEHARFRYYKEGRRVWFAAVGEHGQPLFTCRIKDWQLRAYEVSAS